MAFISSVEEMFSKGLIHKWKKLDLVKGERLNNTVTELVNNQKALQDWVFETRKKYFEQEDIPTESCPSGSFWLDTSDNTLSIAVKNENDEIEWVEV